MFDFAVLGEGEQTTLEVRQALTTGRPVENIQGALSGGRRAPKRPLITPLDSIPIPDRSFANLLYFKPVKAIDGRKLVEGNLLTNRGCPYRCPFCATSLFWQIVRTHSVKRVVEEVSYLKEVYHITCVNVWDDYFTISKKRVNAIAKALKHAGLTDDIEYRIQVRVNTFGEDMAKALKSMNVTNLNFGFESGSLRILKQIKKDVTLKLIKEVVARGRRYDMAVTGSVMFGIPGEPLEYMHLTLARARPIPIPKNHPKPFSRKSIRYI